MEKYSYVEKIIARFGGLTATARALGHEYPTTVQGWKVRGVIPARQQQKIIDAARSRGIDVQPSDFFDVNDHSGAAA